MLAKVFVREFACNSSGAVREVGGLVVREKELWRLSRFWRSPLARLFAPFDDGLEPGDMRTTTSTKTVAVLTTVPKVPRTVSWARPPGAVAATCTEKVVMNRGGPTVAVAGVT